MEATQTRADTDALRKRGIRATKERIALLALLRKANKPVSAGELAARQGTRGIDPVTFYRGLETLADAELVRRVDLRHGHTDYELIEEGKHHHHLVCTTCGDVEEFAWCPDARVKDQILKSAKRFRSVSDHSLEFFGVCKKCSS